MSGSDWVREQAPAPNAATRVNAWARQAMLTKPPGALGRLESLAVELAAMQGRDKPGVSQIAIVVFAADHGVAAEGVSAFPQSVTVEMVRNFARGGAAICVAARQLGAELEVVNVGTVSDPGVLAGVLDQRIGPGTVNFVQHPAMTRTALESALREGYESVERAVLRNAELFIGGEMGIGNTTSATALACVLLDRAPRELSGPGTGLNATGVAHKAEVIERALTRHARDIQSPLDALRCLGGFEIAALTGAFVRAAQMRIPVLVDGYIATVAALAAVRINASVRPYLLFAHCSAEPGHRRVLSALDANAVLDLGMRLGEGSGAAVAVPILRLACALHNEMATFTEAGVSEKGR